MSGAAARCPHCGTLQARAPARERPAPAARVERERPVIRDVTPEEARALIAVHQTLEGRELADEPFNLLAWMFLPDHRSQGGARMAEIVLTALVLPLMIGGIVGAGAAVTYMSRVRRRRGDRALGAAVVGFGLVTIAGVGWSLEWSLPAVAGACIGEMILLGAREAIRDRSKARYGRPDLTT